MIIVISVTVLIVVVDFRVSRFPLHLELVWILDVVITMPVIHFMMCPAVRIMLTLILSARVQIMSIVMGMMPGILLVVHMVAVPALHFLLVLAEVAVTTAAAITITVTITVARAACRVRIIVVIAVSAGKMIMIIVSVVLYGLIVVSIVRAVVRAMVAAAVVNRLIDLIPVVMMIVMDDSMLIVVDMVHVDVMMIIMVVMVEVVVITKSMIINDDVSFLMEHVLTVITAAVAIIAMIAVAIIVTVIIRVVMVMNIMHNVIDTFMLAEQMRINKCIMHSRDLNSIRVRLMVPHLSVERLLGHLLDKLLYSMVVVVRRVTADVVWLHLNNKIALLCVHIGRVENTRVRAKRSTLLEPTSVVEIVEIVTPAEVIVVSVLVVVVNLDIVEEEVPWHILSAEIAAPRVEGRSPEIHLERLEIVQVINSWVMVSGMSELTAIDSPTNMLWRPFKSVGVPLVLRVKMICILMRLQFLVTIAINHVHGKRIRAYRWHNLDIKLVPAGR